MAGSTGNVRIDALLWGGWYWSIDPVTYYFANDYYAWDPAEKAGFRAALNAWSTVAEIEFVEVYNQADAILVEHSLDDSMMQDLLGSGTLGLHETPADAMFDHQADGYFNWELYGYPAADGWYPEALVPGGYGYTTFLHELGHALGLAHPHDDGGGSPLFPGVSSETDTGTYNLNQGVYTVMSYVDGWDLGQYPFANGVAEYGYSAGPSAFDIAAIQFLYGARETHKGGNTVYNLSETGGWMSIWDTGGTDTLRYGGSADAIIDLRPATLGNNAAAGGYLSYLHNEGGHKYYGGYTIAADFTDALANRGGVKGVIIENAGGGSGNDKLVGNGVANVLRGHAGDDLLNGLYGRDTLFGDKGDDLLDGGRGNDRLVGGAGSDVFVFDARGGRDVIVDFRDDVDLLRLGDGLWSGSLTRQQVVDRFAEDLGDHIHFDFGNGQELTLRNFSDLSDLYNDIRII